MDQAHLHERPTHHTHRHTPPYKCVCFLDLWPTDECQSAIGFEDHEAVGPGGVGHARLVVDAVDEQLASDALAGEEVHRQLGPLGEARGLLDPQIAIHRPLISRVGLLWPHTHGEMAAVVSHNLCWCVWCVPLATLM